MTFDYESYDLKHIQTDKCLDKGSHKLTHVYKFYSPKTKFFYILRAEYYENDVFAIKFYRKLDRGCNYKYSKIVNAGDLGSILMTCASVLPLLLSESKYKNSSFCLAGASTIDRKGYQEKKERNQRFNIYSHLIKMKIGDKTFAHFEYPKNSGYMLINRNSEEDVKDKEFNIRQMFFDTYNTVSE